MSQILGDLEELILLSMQRTRRLGRVTSIREDLKRVGIIVSGGAIDRTLRRLESKGVVFSELSQEQRGAGQVRDWFLADAAISALKRSEQTRRAIRSGEVEG